MNTTLYNDIRELAKKWKSYPNEYNPEDPNNRQILIEKNLKMAVGVALKYRGMGLTEDELISAATLGLCAAYEKYTPDKVVLRNKLLGAITDDTTAHEFLEVVTNLMPYGEKVVEKFANELPDTPTKMRQWVYNNIKPAKFSSVAYMWIKAYVLSDLDKYAKPVRVAEKDRGEVFFDYIDGEDMYLCKQITTTDNGMEKEQDYELLWADIPPMCRNIIELRYGLGVDEPLTLREIAEIYDRPVSSIKSIIEEVTEKVRGNAAKHKINIGLFV